jgi:translation initiation factor IF-1
MSAKKFEKVDRDRLIFQGKITDCLSGDNFKVKLTEVPNNPIIKAKIKGKLRQHKIQIVLDDLVEVEISPYDMTNGLISRRK